ncbi:MAG TPA: hypothetical protein VF939_20925 [Puia sp.]
MNRKVFVYVSQEGSTPDVPNTQLLDEYFTAVTGFFSNNCQFRFAKKNLKILLNGAFSKEFVIMDTIPELRALHNGLAKLIGMTSHPKTKDVICCLPEAVDIFSDKGRLKQELYCGPLVEEVYTEWHYFPRYVSKKEFKDPSLVFLRFFEYKSPTEWETVLDDLLSAALSHESVLANSDSIENPFLVQSYLFKFLEATHLMRVRHAGQNSEG